MPNSTVMSELEPIDASEPLLAASPVLRPLCEFLVVLLVGILFARTFAAEAYIVPTGSMAPTLLGAHRDYICPNCKIRFALGVDEDGHVGRPVCPNCGFADWDHIGAVESCGDRLLVQKYLYDLRPPRRWETAVFQNPADPSQAYVKRVVGLPGESVQIRGGDLYINGELARKTLAEQRALRLPVFDNNHLPADAARYPRWVSRRGHPYDAGGGWQPVEAGFRRERPPGHDEQTDWLEYEHWSADRGAFGPVRDFNGYNGLDLPGDNRVRDLMLEAEIKLGSSDQTLLVRIESGPDHFVISLPMDLSEPVLVQRNGTRIGDFRAASERNGLGSRPFFRLEASVFDHRLLVAIDGRLLFEPIDFEDSDDGPAPLSTSPLALGVRGGGVAQIRSLRVFRDIYYTEALTSSLRRPFGIGEPYQLGLDEFFVLGDNSAVSNDSRFWPDSPVVRRELFIGKPFLVHLPSQAVPLQVFGRDLYWIPDPREIRYIR